MADDNDLINQDEIERLLQSAGAGKAAEPGAGPADPNLFDHAL